MDNELIARLRESMCRDNMGCMPEVCICSVAEEAADRIEELEAENQKQQLIIQNYRLGDSWKDTDRQEALNRIEELGAEIQGIGLAKAALEKRFNQEHARIEALEKELRLQKSNAGGAYERIEALEAALRNVWENVGTTKRLGFLKPKTRKIIEGLDHDRQEE